MIVAQWTTFFETELRCNSTFSGQMIYLNTSQDDACEEGRLGFLLEKGEIFNSSKLSVNLLIFKTSCNNLITCTVSSPPAFPTHWTSHLRFKADVANLTLYTGSRPRASISLSKNGTCYFPAIFVLFCLFCLSIWFGVFKYTQDWQIRRSSGLWFFCFCLYLYSGAWLCLCLFVFPPDRASLSIYTAGRYSGPRYIGRSSLAGPFHWTEIIFITSEYLYY